MADKTHKASRRSFLRSSLLAVGGTAGLSAAGGLGPVANLANAAWFRSDGAPQRHYVFVYFSGGWDILLGLDPRDPRDFHSGNLSDTLIQPAYDLLDDEGHWTDVVNTSSGTQFGPYIGDMAQHADKLAVVRGMSMETLTHEAGRRRFITGKVPSGLLARGSSGATWLASRLGADQLVPQISVNVESYNIDQPEYASALKVSNVPDLVRALQPAPSVMGDLEERQIDELLQQAALCPNPQASRMWKGSEEARLGVRAMIEADLASNFDFQANTAEMAALRDHYGIAASGTAALTSPEAQAAMATTALKKGISRVVSIRANTQSLDTHYDQWTTDQGPIQERGFNAIARMIEDLGATEYGDTGDSWFDHTTIVAFSEFSRTARLNANEGRDHALTNACMLVGGGIRGGQVIGASSDIGMEPTPTNLATGQPDQGGEIVKPEHIIRSLMVEAGIEDDVADLRVEPLTALFG
ncbi:MAG: DUF1501 domain-containing protein [Deltaproteobacteria bacterium]|nr:DUF1501 domain-containing protein [Deltaproteobacteria bacterium]